MPLLTQLKTFCRVSRVNLTLKTYFHWKSRPPLYLHKVSPTLQKRTFFFEVFMKPSQRDLKIKDNIPDAFELIYRNQMSRYILGAQIISIITGGLVFLALVVKPDFKSYEREIHEWSTTAKTMKNEEYYYIAFFVVFLVLMQVMVARTPIRIYKVPQQPKYISVNYGNYFFGKEKYSFKRGQISQMEETGILPWKGNRYAIETDTDRRVIILLEHYFRRPSDLNIMLGQQKDPEIDD